MFEYLGKYIIYSVFFCFWIIYYYYYSNNNDKDNNNFDIVPEWIFPLVSCFPKKNNEQKKSKRKKIVKEKHCPSPYSRLLHRFPFFSCSSIQCLSTTTTTKPTKPNRWWWHYSGLFLIFFWSWNIIIIIMESFYTFERQLLCVYIWFTNQTIEEK